MLEFPDVHTKNAYEVSTEVLLTLFDALTTGHHIFARFAVPGVAPTNAIDVATMVDDLYVKMFASLLATGDALVMTLLRLALQDATSTATLETKLHDIPPDEYPSEIYYGALCKTYTLFLCDFLHFLKHWFRIIM